VGSLRTQDADEATRSLSILVVDDDPDMRFLARAVLEKSGIEIAGEAADGPEALDRLRELEPPPIPTVILLDNQMPGPSGLEVAAQILADLPEQLIVLFSAYLSDEIVAQATQLGVSACISKNDALNLSEIIHDLVAATGA
jgi:two-component system, chemotaxis family, chemotaxis protein CheY